MRCCTCLLHSRIRAVRSRCLAASKPRNYKTGGEGVGYHDTTSANEGGAYRNDAVDIQPTTDVGGGYNVGYVRAGEWLAYEVDIAAAGQYDITARVASADSGTKTLHVTVDGLDVSGPISVGVLHVLGFASQGPRRRFPPTRQVAQSAGLA